MTTQNIEELIAKLSYYSGDGVQIDMARQAQRQAADALQSQAERIKVLELDLDVQAGSIEAVQAVNTRQAERIKELEAQLDDATAAARSDQVIAETAQATAARLLTERDQLRAQLVALEADYAETRDELQEANDSLASTYHILGERDAQLSEIAAAEPVIWAISHDGVTPYSLWHDGDGALLDNHVDRLGSPWQKMALYPVPSQNLKDAARYRWLVEYLVSNDTRHDKAIVACESTSELSAFIDTKVEKRG